MTARSADPLAAAMRRLAEGDQDALRTVYDATAAQLLGIVIRILGDREEGEEVLQEVYLAVGRRAAAFDPARATAAGWLTAVARSRAIERLRARGPATVTPASAEGAAAPAAPTARSDEGRRLQACLNRLRPDEAHAIRTAYLEGLTYEALARRTGAAPGTVKTQVRRGLAKLRECLES